MKNESSRIVVQYLRKWRLNVAELKLIYFEGCPNADKIRGALAATGHKFDEVRQDNLPPQHPLKNYSSPSILRNDEIIYGAATGSEGGCSLEIPSSEEIKARLERIAPAEKVKLLAPTGSIGSIVTVILCPVCKPAIAAFLGSVGLGFVVNEAVLQSVLVLFLALAVGGFFWSYLKVHRNIWPVFFGVVLSVALYLGRYVYFGYMENNVLTYGSIAGLIAVSIWNFTLKKPNTCGSCAKTS